MSDCPHCHQPLRDDWHADPHYTRWDECHTCNVIFIEGGSHGPHIKWERDYNNLHIALNIYPQSNLTILSIHNPSKEDPSCWKEITLHTAMQNVTPDNCLEKIKLLLFFH